MKVKKRNGRLEEFNVDKINKCAERASKNLDNVSASEVLIDAKIKLYDKVTTVEIDKSLIMSARSKSLNQTMLTWRQECFSTQFTKRYLVKE